MISRSTAAALVVALIGSAVALYFLLRPPSGTPTQPLVPSGGGTPSLPLVPSALPLHPCVRIKSYEDTPAGFTCDASTLTGDCTVQCCPR